MTVKARSSLALWLVSLSAAALLLASPLGADRRQISSQLRP